MTREEVKSCIGTIEMLQRLAYNIHGVMDVIDADNCKKIIKALKQEPCEDAVSRKKLLKIYEDRFTELQKLKHLKDNKGAEDRQMGVNYCINILKELPPATPQEPIWIPVSEKLPNDRDWYLGIFKEPDTGWINPLPFICDYVGHETKATTKDHWILRGFTDRDEHIDHYFNLECVAWMPLPLPWKGE